MNTADALDNTTAPADVVSVALWKEEDHQEQSTATGSNVLLYIMLGVRAAIRRRSSAERGSS